MPRDWRRYARAGFVFVVGAAAGMPLFVEATGIPARSSVVASVVAVSAGVTRLMALSQFKRLLPSWLWKEPPSADE